MINSAPREANNVAEPILVTGSHRSGTTWVGRMLTLSSAAHYVHEPFAPMYGRSWLNEPPTQRYLYIPPGAYHPVVKQLSSITNLKPDWLAIARRSPTFRNFFRLLQEAYLTRRARKRGAAALVKDPFLLASAEWFVKHTNARCIVLIRHPAAFVSSIKRLGWRLDPKWLLNQPLLMRDFLEPFRYELELDAKQPTNLVNHGCLIWNVLNSISYYHKCKHPEWIVTRYEDLASFPTTEFKKLYKTLGLPWSNETERTIYILNSAKNPTDVSKADRLEVRRNSRKAIHTWKNRLTDREISLIYEKTHAIADHWYPTGTWSRDNL